MGQDQVREWTEFPELEVLEFNDKARRHREITDQIKKLEAEKKSLGTDIEAALAVAGMKSVAIDDLIAIQCNGSTASTISRTALAVAGVDPDVIKACTIGGTKYTYVQVKRKGEKD